MRLVDEIREGLVISWHAILGNKLRSGLTTLGIVIGILTVTLMATAIDGLNVAFKKSMAGLGADVLYVQRFTWAFGDMDWWKLRNRRPMLVSYAKEISRMSKFAMAISVESDGNATVSYDKRTARGVWIAGNTDQSLLVRGIGVRLGRFLSTAESDGGRPVCVLGDDVAKRLFPNENPLQKRVKIGSGAYEVIGVMDKMGQFFTGFNFDNQVVIPVTRFTSDLTRWPDVSINVRVRDVKDMGEAEEELRGIMRKIRRLPPGEPDDFGINQQEFFLKAFNRIGSVIASLGLFITSLSLFVGGIGIMNIMFVSVAERTKEIGVRKAIGAKQRTILIQFLIEAALICGLGGLIGLAIAVPLSLIIDHFLAARLSPVIAGAALGLSLLTGVVSGFLPAWRAARMTPVDALRSE